MRVRWLFKCWTWVDRYNIKLLNTKNKYLIFNRVVFKRFINVALTSKGTPRRNHCDRNSETDDFAHSIVPPWRWSRTHVYHMIIVVCRSSPPNLKWLLRHQPRQMYWPAVVQPNWWNLCGLRGPCRRSLDTWFSTTCWIRKQKKFKT